jgi:hypothetical protein
MSIYDRFSPRDFWRLALAAGTLKVLLAALIPLTGDEAYFLSWARFPALGYYDHPPMAGWIAWMLSPLGDGILWPRIFTAASSTLIGCLLFIELRRHMDEHRASVLGALYFLSPVYLVNTLFTTDSGLILFAFLSGLVFVRALRNDSAPLMLFCGALLGFAFLSKYFAALLLPAFAVMLFLRRRSPWRNLTLIGLGMLPFVLLHLHWNWQNCWVTLRFNLSFRSKSGLQPGEFLEHLLFQLYLATPWAAGLLLLGRREVAARVRSLDLTPLALFYLVPLMVLTIAAFRGSGLHWALAFYPFFPALLGGLDYKALRTVFYAHGGLFLVQVTAVLVLLALPVSLLKDHPRYAYVVAFTRGEEVCRALEPFRDDYVFVASTGYTTSAVMSRFCGVHLPVLLGSSVYGRLDDTVTDFRLLDGRDLLVFGLRPINEQNFRPYFREVEPRTIVVGGGTFHLLLGRGFSFEAYRQGFLTKLKERYYSIPESLPCGGCPFLERYFPEELCGR